MFFNNTRLQSLGKFNRCLAEEFQIFQNVDLKHQLVAYLSGLAPNHFIVFRIKNAAVIIETIKIQYLQLLFTILILASILWNEMRKVDSCVSS